MTHAERIELLKSQLNETVPTVWAEPFHEAWMAAEGSDPRVRLAAAQAAEMAAVVPVIRPGELIIGLDALHPSVTSRYTAFEYGIRFDEVRLAQVRELHPEASQLLEEIATYWPRWYRETGYCQPMEMHASLGYELFLEHGIDGMRRRVGHWAATNTPGDPECGPWYQALVIVLGGVSAFIRAHAAAAEQAAQQAAQQADDPQRREELLGIAEACQHISTGAPRTFHEAVQLFYFVFWLCGHDSPGPMDRYLYPCLKQELSLGSITLERAQEIVDCLFLKLEEKTAYGATIGGQLEDGSDACNELTSLLLQATRRLRLLSPRTAFRWHPAVSQDAFAEACEVVASGASLPGLINDVPLVSAMVGRGIALGHARNYSFVGCGQTYPHGRGHGSYEDVIINSAKPLELALHNGVDPVAGRQIGPETGHAEQLSSWEQFTAAYQIQMDRHISAAIESVNARRAAHAGQWHDFLRSMVSYSCVERGKDWHAGGTDYSEGMVDMVGMTTTTDSLVAIRRAVYEEGLLSLAELRDVLDGDWKGREELRLYFLRKLPKFGNGDPEADTMAAGELERVNRHVRSHRTVFGGPWGVDVIGWSGAVELGRHTGATPDGRRRGESLADCAGPAQGRNICGLTATLNSVLKLPHDQVHGPLVLSLRFPPAAVAGSAGVERLRAVVETYFRGGGQDLQISIAGTDQMRAARENPEAHRDLMVRVGGFSAYFIHLDPAFQDDMIARSEAAV